MIIKQNRAGFDAKQAADMSEQDFIDFHVKANVWEHYPKKDRVEMLKLVHKKAKAAFKKEDKKS